MAKKVLLVAPMSDISGRLLHFLEEMGYVTHLCDNAKNAINDTLSFNPALIVAEDQMPVLSGTELARLFKANTQFRDTPFLLLTRKATTSRAIAGHGGRSADEILVMPFDQAEFYEVVSRLLESGETRTARPKTKSPDSDFGLIRGRISTIGLVRAFFSLMDSHVGGHLRCKADRKKLRLSIIDGRVVDAESNYIRPDSFGRFLVEIRKITEKEHAATLEKAERTGVTQADVLLKLGVITEAEMREVQRKLKVKETLAVFEKTWQGGYFEFRPETVIAAPDSAANLKIPDFLKQGLKRHVSIRWTYRAFERRAKDRQIIRIDPRFDHVAKLLELNAEMIEMARQLEGRSLAEIRHDPSWDTYDLVHLVFLLTVTHAIRLGDPPARVHKATASEDEREIDAPLPFETETEHDREFVRLFQMAQLAFNDQNFRAAENALRKALDFNDRSSDAWAMLAWVRFSSGDRVHLHAAQEAKDLLKRALILKDDNDMAHYYLGMILKQENKLSLAASHFQQAFDLNPLNEDAEKEAKLIALRMKNDRRTDLVD